MSVLSFCICSINNEDRSISRCTYTTRRTNTVFTLSSPTPLQINLCPSEDYAITVQMRLVNAVYHVWMENPSLVDDLREVFVDGVNEYCQCGFNGHYLKGMRYTAPPMKLMSYLYVFRW